LPGRRGHGRSFAPLGRTCPAFRAGVLSHCRE
jgi:hypothetical protein